MSNIFNKFKFVNSSKLNRSQSFDTKEKNNKRLYIENIPENFAGLPEEDESESTLDISIQDVEMANAQQKDYHAMILHISNNYMFSATVTPRDRKEIQNGLPAWNGWILTLTGKTEDGKTAMPESIIKLVQTTDRDIL